MITVLFEHHHFYYLPQFIPIIQELQKRSRYTVITSITKSAGEEEERFLARQSARLGLECITAGNEAERIRKIHQVRPQVVVVGHSIQLKQVVPPASLLVLVYHGIGLKQSYYRDISPRVDLRSVESEARFTELQGQGLTNLVLTGFTKLDPLFQGGGMDRSRWLEGRGLDPDLKTVLYAPSFYPSSAERLLPALGTCKTPLNVVIKLHHFSWRLGKYRRQRSLAEALRSRPRVYLLPPEEFDIVPWYRVADLLISDISSTLFEFLVLDRPIIQAEMPTLRFRHRLFPVLVRQRLDYRRMAQVDFTIPLNEPEKLEATLREALSDPGHLAPQRQQAAQRFLYRRDGKASARLVEAIKKRLGP